MFLWSLWGSTVHMDWTVQKMLLGSIEREENRVHAGRLRGGEAQRVRDLPVLTLPIPALLLPLLHQAVLRAGNCTFRSPTMMKTTTKTLVQEYLPKTQARATSTPALDRPQTWETPASSHHLLQFHSLPGLQGFQAEAAHEILNPWENREKNSIPDT